MPAVFLFISPVDMDDRRWLAWRRGTRGPEWPPAGVGRGYGDALTIAAPHDPEAANSPAEWLAVLEQIIVDSRFNTGVLQQLPQLAHRIGAAFVTQDASDDVAVMSWAMASAKDGPVVTTAVFVSASASELACRLDQTEARRRFNDAVFGTDSSSDIAEAVGFLRSVGLQADTAQIRCDATQLLCLVHTPDAHPDALLAVHREEEGDAENAADELDVVQALGCYLHVGFSNTTAVGDRMPAMMLLAPIAIKAQSIWFAQRELRAHVLAIDFEGTRQGRQETTTLLLRLQELRFELHLWDSEVEAYRTGLVPWQARILQRYLTSWALSDGYARLSSLVEHACELLRSTAERLDGIVEARQANILAVIAIMQLIGIAAAVVGYFDLAKDADIHLDSIEHGSAFAVFVDLLPAVTAVAVICLIVAARRRR